MWGALVRGCAMRSRSAVQCAKLTNKEMSITMLRFCGCISNVSSTHHFSMNAKTLLQSFHYNQRDTILYALGVGATTSNIADLKFLYEGHEHFSVLPTYFIVPSLKIVQDSGIIESVFPGKNISSAHLLHGEQYLEVMKPLQTSRTLQSHAKVVDILDKVSGAVLIVDVETFSENEELLTFNQLTLFIVGAGDFGGKRVSEKRVVNPVNPPSRPPDVIVEQKTSCDQAAIYRLSGDWNPLHIDSSCAAMGGFSRPILHGLCTLGFSARHVLHHFANSNTLKFKAVKVRFVKPVYPGQTLQTVMWQESKRIHFTTKVVETGTTVISGAYVDLMDVSIIM